MSDTVTSGIRVQVRPTPLPERSRPDEGLWAFAYAVTISNEGTTAAKLRRRHWVITDATGHIEEVRGDGVVGEQPRLEPGQSFQYTSWAMLRTVFGSMYGSYTFVRDDGSAFEARIAEFALSEPLAVN